MSTRTGLTGLLSSFASLDACAIEELEALAIEAPILELRRGDILIRQGESAESLYFVLSGRFSIVLEGTQQPIDEIAQGQPIGEIGFFANLPRTATVVALRDSRVLGITRERFRTICDGSPRLRDLVIATLARRLSHTHQRIAPAAAAIRTIAVLSAGGSQMTAPFVDALRTALAAQGRTLLLTAADIAAQFANVPPDDPAVTNWLNALEDQAKFIIYLAEPQLTDWTKKCIRQADTILLVADAQASSQLNPSEAFAFEVHARTSRRLVILHNRRTLVAHGTSAWLANRDMFMHHHVALHDLADVERLCRFISGRAIGFVASGGGALGAAHLGVFKALREAGVEFDILGGTSAGAAMMAGLALTDDPDRVNNGIHSVFVRSGAFRRLTLPRFGLIDHKAFDRALQVEYDEALIEDLWTPYFALSSNLSDQKPRIHRQGLVWQSVRASGSIPGVLPPFFTREGEMLVDGALMQNVPIESMNALKAGPNVIVALNTHQPKSYPVNYELIPGPGQLASAMLNPFSRNQLHKIPSILQVLVLSMLANNRAVLEPGEADVLIVPGFPGHLGFMSWDHHNEIFLGAYRDAAARIRNRDTENESSLQALLATSIAAGVSL